MPNDVDPTLSGALPPIVDEPTWEAAVAELRRREKAATRELDAIAAARRRLPMVELPDYTLEGAGGPVRLADVFEGAHQLIVYSHMFPLIDLLPYGRQEEWQDSPEGWPQSPTYSRWAPPEAFAQYAGE